MFVSSRRRARVCEPLSPARICVSACRSTRSTFPFSRLFTEFKGPFFLENVTRDDLYISFHGLLTRRPESSRAGVQVQNRHFRPLQITSSSAKQISAISTHFTLGFFSGGKVCRRAGAISPPTHPRCERADPTLLIA